MRTIKFRGFNKKNGEWLFGSYILNRKHHFVVPDEFAECKTWEDYEVGEGTIGQFTGLYDKNGKEIYEGDILQWGVRDYKIKQVVMFLHGAFGYKCDPYTFVSYVGNSNFNFWAKGTDSRFEIIGNIHDNPELQKGGEE